MLTSCTDPRAGGELIPGAFPDVFSEQRKQTLCIYDFKDSELQGDEFLSSEAVWCLSGAGVSRSLATGGLRFESKCTGDKSCPFLLWELLKEIARDTPFVKYSLLQGKFRSTVSLVLITRWDAFY